MIQKLLLKLKPVYTGFLLNFQILKPRTKKYLTSTKQGDNKKKGSASNAGYDEQNEITYKAPKKNPATIESDDLKSKKVKVEAKTKEG